MMSITDIPGYKIDNCTLTKDYGDELKGIDNAKDLKAFVEKWKALWLIPVSIDRTSNMREKVGNLRFNPTLALECIETSRKMMCKHAEKKELCPGGEIVLPSLLLKAWMAASVYGVPLGVAIHQLFCTDEQHTGCLE